MQTRVDIVPRLWQAAESIPSVADLLNEAAAEIEHLRQRCEQIDQEWRDAITTTINERRVHAANR